MRPRIEIKTSPHIKEPDTVERIMRSVVLALLPVCAFSVYQFGISVAALLVVTTVTAVLTEQLFNQLSGRASTIGDYSAVITGLLLALTLPPAFPLWMAAVSAFVAIALGKALFGGLGYNPFNPALLGRAFAAAAFPEASSTWTQAGLADRFTEFLPSTLALPFMTPDSVDAYTTATPLAEWKFEGQIATETWDLMLGTIAGSAGETSALLVLVCGLFLVLRGAVNWRVPVSVLGSAAATAGVFYALDPAAYPDPLFVLASGALMLGAFFMASDMSSSPVTPAGIWIYGILIGFLTVIIRFFGGLPEGVMYAILLGNAAVPLIERIAQPRMYGLRKRRG
ncbi:MAG: RnfABCDGE type electron transport complex subunit D [Halorhodospira halophila]|nr:MULTISPECIES: RnfABCDGE type electron transport complex subunit D [Halorhodospira]MBK5936934.1 electron transporter RnfD [Halorhodospira halophila]MCC3750693.1 RnfABCDGE type electron transport complex subunit D [Halorhodospira halophila]MCG5528163.1 RnfABCDGE type electron transport complex subunit D [Halorhodospira halophila]MCG5537580.1 RnfABCDGE type electron transport complex subunit D [Halorhodospira sp. 9622]MCG5542965.1 RnfABCDGE type electron transport complex subunit D [Halorhodos